MKPLNRRTFLCVAGLSLLTPYVVTHTQDVAAQTSSNVLLDERWFAVNPAQAPERVFSLSVVSGEPSPGALDTRQPGGLSSGSTVSLRSHRR